MLNVEIPGAAFLTFRWRKNGIELVDTETV